MTETAAPAGAFGPASAQMGNFPIYAPPGKSMIRTFFFRGLGTGIFPRAKHCQSTPLKTMGKNTDTTSKAAAPAKRTAKPAAINHPTARQAATEPAKAGNSKPKRAVKPAAHNGTALGTEDVALRAYFIAEKRRQDGLPGDEHQDWLEAERQLRVEANGTKPAGRKRASAA